MRILFTLIGILFLIGCHPKKRVISKNTRKKNSFRKRNVQKHKQTPIAVKPKSSNTKLKVKTSRKKSHKEITLSYIERFAFIAMKEMQDYRIPASITLAQGILESGSGKSPLALRSNNHFGIKCHKGWKGKSVTHDDDKLGECFRKYKHPESSYEDHSKFLTSRKRYSKLFKLSIFDYKGWAYGLKRAGYATDPRYPRKLIALIEKHNLTEYDKKALNKKQNKSIPKKISVKKYHLVKKGETLYSISRKYKTSLENLKRMNNLTNNTIAIGQKLKIY